MDVCCEDTVFDKLLDALKIDDRVVVTSRLFYDLKTDADRVALAFQLLQDEDLLPRCNFTSEKSARLSRDLRNKGNIAYREGKDWEAMGLYNLSLGAAPFDSSEFALAAGNRSAVQFALGYPKACVQDIALAVQHGYPEELRFKLLERRAKCLITLRKRDEAFLTVKDLRDSLENTKLNLSKEKQLTYSKALQMLETNLNMLQNEKDEPAIERSHFGHEEKPKVSYGQNVEIECASDSISLLYNKEMGRHIVATRDIEPGDVLIVEEPYISVLLPDYLWTHCYNCLNRCVCAIPCFHCAKVLYCSDLCRSKSWELNHRIDCSLLPALIGRMGRMSLLATRVLLVASNQGTHLQDLQERVTNMEANLGLDERTLGFNEFGKYVSTDYCTVHFLVANSEKRSVADLFRRAVNAACLLYYLEQLTTFFNNSCDDLRWFAGGILLRHLQSLPCNAHEVSEMMMKDGHFESIEIGGAAYATHSLINHSCDPNVVRHSYGDNVVLRAIRPIRAGEELFDNYSYHYSVQDREERCEKLQQQYLFVCCCTACEDEWPLYAEQPTSCPRFKCVSCQQPVEPAQIEPVCQFCGVIVNTNQLQEKLTESSTAFRKHIKFIRDGRFCKDTVEMLQAHLSLMDRILVRPWREYSECQEAIKQCFSLQANHCVDVKGKKDSTQSCCS